MIFSSVLPVSLPPSSYLHQLNELYSEDMRFRAPLRSNHGLAGTNALQLMLR